ncbi:hypothetical protein [Streptomyces sp. NPDC051001]|uniref:hypothetical protein n=1 Tax=Streptomyces sp. NPDC051001 TaxID=3155795 RepID=UPI00342B5D31
MSSGLNRGGAPIAGSRVAIFVLRDLDPPAVGEVGEVGDHFHQQPHPERNQVLAPQALRGRARRP